MRIRIHIMAQGNSTMLNSSSSLEPMLVLSSHVQIQKPQMDLL